MGSLSISAGISDRQEEFATSEGSLCLHFHVEKKIMLIASVFPPDTMYTKNIKRVS